MISQCTVHRLNTAARKDWAALKRTERGCASSPQCPRNAWLQTFFQIPFVWFNRTTKWIQHWNNSRLSKWWENFNFWVNYPNNSCSAVTQIIAIIIALYIFMLTPSFLFIQASSLCLIPKWDAALRKYASINSANNIDKHNNTGRGTKSHRELKFIAE